MAELPAWRWQVWSASVRGASHLRSQTPNQDAVAHWVSEPNPRGPVILAVADGHGSDRSYRSDIGSQLAVAMAIETCRDFVNDLREATPSQVKQSAEQRLPNLLVKQWQSEVERHWQNNPLTDAERERWPAARDLASREAEATPKEKFRIYGSTLLVILADEAYALFLQLGDGDLLVVQDDAEANLSVSRPIARDETLIANETTSLCQLDAASKFQVRLSVFGERPPALLLACTDGYSNGFETPAGFEQVGPDLCRALRQDGVAIIGEELPAELERVSSLGSGDDVTAGFIFREDVQP